MMVAYLSGSMAQSQDADPYKLEQLADEACSCLKEIINPIEDEELLQIIENIAKYGPQQGLDLYRRSLNHLDPGQQQERWTQISGKLEPIYKKATDCEARIKKNHSEVYEASRKPENRKYVLEYLSRDEVCHTYARYVLK